MLWRCWMGVRKSIRPVDGSHAKHLTIKSYTVVMLLTVILIIIIIIIIIYTPGSIDPRG